MKLLIVLLSLLSLPAQAARYGTLMAVPKNLNMMELPTCFDAQCMASIYRVDVQVKTPHWLLVDAYGEYKDKSHFAHVFRLATPTHWVWVIVSEDTFFHKALKVWAKEKPSVIGPAPVESLPRKPAVCAQLAPKVLVGVTTDAGTLRQPNPTTTVQCPPSAGPTDAGPPLDCRVTVTAKTWTAAQVLTCRDGGGPYYLKQLRHGGVWINGWSDDPDGGIPTTGAAKRLPSRVPTGWGWAPDARVTKTCPPVPVGTQCP